MNNETLNTLITVLITGFVTLLAVYLTNRANYKKLLLQTDLEREFKLKEITHEKLEELYVLTDAWLNSNFTYWLPYHKVMLGELTYNDALNLSIKQGEEGKHKFNRMKMLIDLYFNSVRKKYDDVINIQSNINRILDEPKREYKKGNIDGLHFVQPFLNEQKIFLEKSYILMQSIT